MPITPRQVTTPALGSAAWGTGVGSAGNKWATNYASPKRNPFDPSVVNPDGWQAGVSTAEAKTKYRDGMVNVDQNMVLASVNGAGKTKYTTSGTTKVAKYASFANAFYPWLANELNSLNQTNPRGPRGTNLARFQAYHDALVAARGSF